MANKLHIKKGDNVLVVSGRDKGKRGRVLRVLGDQRKVVVEAVNMIKRHTRANPRQAVQGGILEREAPIGVAKLALICPESGKPTRVGRKRLADGKGARVSKVSGATIA